MGWPLNGDRMAPAGKAQGMCLVVGLDKDTVEKQCNFPSDCPFWRNQWVYRIISNIKFRQISTSLDKSSLHIPFQEPVISSRSILKLELVSILKKSSLGRPLQEAHGGSWWNSSERSWSHLEIGELSELHEAGCTDGLTMKYHEMGSSSWDSIDSMSLLRCAIDIPLIDIILIHLVAINWFNWWCPTPNPDPGIPRARPRQGQLQ